MAADEKERLWLLERIMKISDMRDDALRISERFVRAGDLNGARKAQDKATELDRERASLERQMNR